MAVNPELSSYELAESGLGPCLYTSLQSADSDPSYPQSEDPIVNAYIKRRLGELSDTKIETKFTEEPRRDNPPADYIEEIKVEDIHLTEEDDAIIRGILKGRGGYFQLIGYVDGFAAHHPKLNEEMAERCMHAASKKFDEVKQIINAYLSGNNVPDEERTRIAAELIERYRLAAQNKNKKDLGRIAVRGLHDNHFAYS